MTSTTSLQMIDGVTIVVPDSLNLITPYVLLEQQDWFEDEIKFLRRLLNEGQKVIDIGANYGVYTLSMAKTVGPRGCVWAFEPASSTATMLAEAISANGFTQVVLEQSALSFSCGLAQLTLNSNSELNALVRSSSASNTSETVPLVTLDERMDYHGWSDIEFIKIDAEGEEANIIKGGERFFKELSALVMYEVKADEKVHMELVQKFATLGYDSYRLVPGLDLLIPFDVDLPPDGFLLNLFCCKRDRAERLAAQGFLLESVSRPEITLAELAKAIVNKARGQNTYQWQHTISKMSYGQQLNRLWEQTMALGNSEVVDEALFLYATSRDKSLSSRDRFDALETCFYQLKNLCENHPENLRLASFARVARDYGARLLAVNALSQLRNSIKQQKRVNLNEPFLAPSERFDFVPTGNSIENWLLAAVLEQLERLSSFSSYYTAGATLQRLINIRALGFGSAEMERRLSLLQKRFGKPTV